MHYLLYNSTKNIALAEKLLVADHFWQRMRGLLGKKEILDNEGLLLVPCNAVHTMFMRFPIDVLFISSDFMVLKVIENLQPWRATSIVRGSYQIVELKAGIVAKTGTVVGDTLAILSMVDITYK